MAKQKFDTIEEAAEAMGVEINDKTIPFLNTFVKKTGSNTGAKKRALFDEVVAMGVEGLDFEKETMESLKVRGCQYLHTEGEFDALAEFAARFNLVVDEDSGAIFRIKAKIKPIEERNAGSKEGTVGWATIKMLQSEDYAGNTVAELVELFPEFVETLGYPDMKPTTGPSIQWYINFCRKKDIDIIDRPSKRFSKTTEEGTTLGAELTLEKALAPRGFKKKAGVEAIAGEEASGEDELDLD